MFNNEELRNAVPVRLALTDGRMIEGNLMLPLDVKFKRVLNSDGNGVEFQTHEGVDSVISKSAIVEIIAVEAEKTEEEAAAEAEAQNATPADQTLEAYKTLGIPASATAEQAKAAYDALRMEYHPDRFRPIGLPGDVLDYVVDKSQRIDAAYGLIASSVAAQPAADAPAAPQTAPEAQQASAAPQAPASAQQAPAPAAQKAPAAQQAPAAPPAPTAQQAPAPAAQKAPAAQQTPAAPPPTARQA